MLVKLGYNEYDLETSLTTIFCPSKLLGGGVLMTMIVTSGVLWGSRKNIFRRFRCKERGGITTFVKLGKNTRFLKEYIGKIPKVTTFFCYSNFNSKNEFIEKYF